MQTIPSFFEESVNKFSNNIYLWEKTGTEYSGTTYAETYDLVQQFATGLYSLGVQKGDRVALMSEGRNAWIISELGILYNGAVNVPLSIKLAEADELRYRLSHAGVKMAIVSANQLSKIAELKSSLPELKTIIVLDDITLEGEDKILYSQVLEKGKQLLQEKPDVLNQTKVHINPNDPANICYTSGTTAAPKGIMLSHNNYVANVLQSYTLMDIPPYYTTLVILPWDHAFAHTAGLYCMMGKGASLASVQVGKTGMDTLKNIPINIRENRPHLLMSVPSLANNFKKNIEKNIRDKGTVINALFKHALKLAYAYNGNGYKKGKGLTFLYKPLLALYDKILFSKIREGFGGRLEFFIGGGALLDIEYQRFFYAIGMPMFQGYGLSEASPVISSNVLAKHKLGSSGGLVKNMELKICDPQGIELPPGQPGEIVIKGENVMLGYWNNPEATAETIRDGWLFTGDLGYMDADDFLMVLGRSKSLLIADDGEKYSPEGIEEAITSHSRYISQCMLYNNQNTYTTALIVPEKAPLLHHLKHKGLQPDSDAGVTEALATIEHELKQYRPHGHYSHMFPQRWLPSAVGILSEGFTENNHMMNSTMKMVRGKITEFYTPLIDFLYTPEGKDIQHAKNKEAMRKLLNS